MIKATVLYLFVIMFLVIYLPIEPSINVCGKQVDEQVITSHDLSIKFINICVKTGTKAKQVLIYNPVIHIKIQHLSVGVDNC